MTNLSSILKKRGGNSPEVQWLRLHAFIAEGVGSIPGRVTKIPQAAWYSQKINPKKTKQNKTKQEVVQGLDMAALCERFLLPAVRLYLQVLHSSERGHFSNGRSTTYGSMVSDAPSGGLMSL